MPEGMVVYRFGPFEFDAEKRRLFRQQARVPLSTPQAAILERLLAQPGHVVPKDTLIDAAWDGLAVSPNSYEQALHRLRKVLGDRAAYIETVPREGCRFTAPVERVHRDGAGGPLEAQLEPFVAFVQGLAQLDTLDRHRIREARQSLEEGLRRAPDYARAHVVLAMACGLVFEASATDERRDRATLEAGLWHARRGCEIDPTAAEAWSVLAFVLEVSGHTAQAIAAACKAIALEPGNWRHALRLAKVAWGEERLQAARRALALCPGLALAHWLSATVFIARGAFETALEELRTGCAAQDVQAKGAGFPAVGLHLLHGLVLAAVGRLEDAASEFERELSSAEEGHVYAGICAANTWYALGAIRTRQRRHDEGQAAFARALLISPWHVSATAAVRGEVPPTASPVEALVGRAIVLARGNRHGDAARTCCEALRQAPPGHAGWMLPVEPLLTPPAHGDVWKETLALVRVRAT